ncbi:hypothetical protein E2C01_021900 [Portunus trituberculatus]|uniref:Uncharacterized protein n=1 Tax=Portunus trituberculatus TaxID=210409 RepID=A0A5B7E400_PORTR|nr:hypothetical protein [Portunus trituberculatus]
MVVFSIQMQESNVQWSLCCLSTQLAHYKLWFALDHHYTSLIITPVYKILNSTTNIVKGSFLAQLFMVQMVGSKCGGIHQVCGGVCRLLDRGRAVDHLQV